MEVSKHTEALIKKSNELACIVKELDDRKRRAWQEFHENAKQSHALEDAILAGDMTHFEKWKSLKQKVHAFTNSDDFSEPLRKARGDYQQAHKAAIIALQADTGLVWAFID